MFTALVWPSLVAFAGSCPALLLSAAVLPGLGMRGIHPASANSKRNTLARYHRPCAQQPALQFWFLSDMQLCRPACLLAHDAPPVTAALLAHVPLRTVTRTLLNHATEMHIFFTRIVQELCLCFCALQAEADDAEKEGIKAFNALEQHLSH